MINYSHEDIVFINPDTIKSGIDKYAGIIANILSLTYGEDYPGVSSVERNNLQGIISGKQYTAIWAVGKDDFEKGLFGTSSVVDMSNIYGKGYGEICKSATIGGKGRKLGHDIFLEEYMEGRSGLDIFNALVATSRNCPQRNLKGGRVLRSGVPIRIINIRDSGYTQWGIAPWYIMPDEGEGSYEILDLSIKFRSLAPYIDYINSNPIYLIGQSNRILLDGFIKLNLNVSPKFGDVDDFSREINKWSFNISDYKTSQNPVFVCPDKNGTPISDVNSDIMSVTHSTTIFMVPLTIEYLYDQSILESQGYKLVGFLPGTNIDGNIVTPFKGMWVKIKDLTKSFSVPNYYFERDGLSPDWYYDFVEKFVKDLGVQIK